MYVILGNLVDSVKSNVEGLLYKFRWMVYPMSEVGQQINVIMSKLVNMNVALFKNLVWSIL
ncbi:MAG: hypothetical protein ABIH09_03500, partial [Candidatus Omnitrophota bacterium]